MARACTIPHSRRVSPRLAAVCIAVLVAALAGTGDAHAQSAVLTPFGGQTFEQPLDVRGAPGDPSRIFVVEARGRIRLVRGGVTQPAPFLNIEGDVLGTGEGGCDECGMFSMAPAPDYAQSGLFYVFYTRDDPTIGNRHYLRVEEFRRASGDPEVANPASRRVVLEVPHLTAAHHNGGTLAFGPDGYLYLSTGDGGNTPDQARSPTSALGKLLRFHPAGKGPGDHSIPVGNPFADGTGGNVDEVFAYGLRNPYRFSFDRSTGDLLLADVGQTAWEEVNHVPEGGARAANFGWNCFEGGQAYAGAPAACSPPPSNHTPPVFQYRNPPSGASAVIGGYVVRDPGLPALTGRYLYADNAGALGDQLRSFVPVPGAAGSDAGTGLFVPGAASFGQDACGHVYVAAADGIVSRLDPPAAPPACKLAPKPSVDSRSAKRGAIVVRVGCDEDCTASATGSVWVKRGRREPLFAVPAKPASARVQRGEPLELRLALPRKGAKRVRRALANGRGALARYEVTVSGAGGGSEAVSGRVRLKG